MSDDVDAANDQAEANRQAAIMIRKPSGPSASGYCLNCDHPLPIPKRWCCSMCRDEWEREGG